MVLNSLQKLLSLLLLAVLFKSKANCAFTQAFRPLWCGTNATNAKKSRSFCQVVVMSARNKSKEIYDIPGSGWKSPEWNWGYAVGTGHDCALICRRKFSSVKARKELIQTLFQPKEISSKDEDNGNRIKVEDADVSRDPPFEEVKLILGLTIQRGRWDGTDGGRNGGYGEVLYTMAQAERYESNDEETNAKLFVQDMSEKFHLIATNEFEEDVDNGSSLASAEFMKKILNDHANDYDTMRRRCTALVLQKMGFVQLGC